MRDPYEVLGVSPDADDTTVTKAYRSLARRYHPDLNPGDKSAEQKMQEINSAYDTIKDIRSGKKNYIPGGEPEPSPYGGAYQNYSGNTNGDSPYSDGDFGGYSDYSDEEFRRVWQRSSGRGVTFFRIPIFRIIFILLLLRFAFWLLFSFMSFLGGYPSDYGQSRGTAYYEEYSPEETSDSIQYITEGGQSI